MLGTAIVLADLFDATAVGVHVRENGTHGPQQLAKAAGVELREAVGVAIEQIVAATEQPDVAALVLGARGVHGGPQPAGHTALEIITRVPKPVAVVPPHAQPPKDLNRILVPLEGSSESSHALADTIELAHRRRLEILVLHIHSPATVPASPITSPTRPGHGTRSSSYATSPLHTTASAYSVPSAPPPRPSRPSPTTPAPS